MDFTDKYNDNQKAFSEPPLPEEDLRRDKIQQLGTRGGKEGLV